MPKLVVVVAFERGDDGELFPAFGPADQQSEERAVRLGEVAGLETRRRYRMEPGSEPIAWRVRSADNVVSERRSAEHGSGKPR